VCMRDVKGKHTRVHLLSAFLRAKGLFHVPCTVSACGRRRRTIWPSVQCSTRSTGKSCVLDPCARTPSGHESPAAAAIIVSYSSDSCETHSAKLNDSDGASREFSERAVRGGVRGAVRERALHADTTPHAPDALP